MSTVDPQEVQAIEDGFTKGWSPKTILAVLFPFIAGIAGTIVDWIASGQFDVTAVRLAGATLVLSLVAGLGAFTGRTGKVIGPPATIEASDELLAQHLANKE